jgi:hypothetical protein
MRKIFISLLFSMALLAGCIHNDLPYPVVVPNITSMTVQDAVEVDIDYEARVVTVYVSETTDLTKVVIQSVDYDVDITKPSIQLLGVHDLTTPLKFQLTTYQDYDWIIRAVRPVERYFTIEGQIGSSIIDDYNCRVVAMVSEGTDITNLKVTSLKLGPKDITTYSLAPDQMKDFTGGLDLEVTAFGLTELWTIYVEETEVSVEIAKLNPWTTSAYVSAMAAAGKETVFYYRTKGSTDWMTVDSANVTSDGGSYTAHITGLQPLSDYEVMVSCGDDKTPVEEFTTAPATRIPNGSFEYASLVRGSNYYKFYDPSCGVEEGEYMFWGSGNGEGPEGVNGSANMGIIITTIDKNSKIDGKQSVCAQTSQMAGILAAGNLFTGQFAGLVGTSGGKVNFGRPWTSRPTALKIWCKYQTGKINILNNSNLGVSKDDYDRAQIKVAVGTWDFKKYGGTKDSPVHVNTTDASTFVDFYTDKSTIANGDLIIYNDGYMINNGEKVTATTSGWIEYIIPLDYRQFTTYPTHIVISCATSQFGDYFTGYDGGRLWIDAAELIYE